MSLTARQSQTLYCVKPVNCHQKERAREKRLTEGEREREGVEAVVMDTTQFPRFGCTQRCIHTISLPPAPYIGKNDTDRHSHFINYIVAGAHIDPAYIVQHTW